MALFFTSDTHYWHRNIIEFSRRPFSSLEVMHHELVQRWNARVGVDDIVYHLGGVSFAGRGHTLMVLSQLKGHIKFVRGNHDKKFFGRPGLDEDVGQYVEIQALNKKIVLCHYPLLTWNRAHHGSWMLHGHSHGSLDKKNEETTRLDVGVDGIAQYAPISIEEIAQVFQERSYKIVDQHGSQYSQSGK